MNARTFFIRFCVSATCLLPLFSDRASAEIKVHNVVRDGDPIFRKYPVVKGTDGKYLIEIQAYNPDSRAVYPFFSASQADLTALSGQFEWVEVGSMARYVYLGKGNVASILAFDYSTTGSKTPKTITIPTITTKTDGGLSRNSLLKGLRVDGPTGMLYWIRDDYVTATRTLRLSVWLANPDGSGARNVLDNRDYGLLDVALDSIGGMLYWIEGMNIYSKNLSSNAVALVTTIPKAPGGLAYDMQQQKLFILTVEGTVYARTTGIYEYNLRLRTLKKLASLKYFSFPFQSSGDGTRFPMGFRANDRSLYATTYSSTNRISGDKDGPYFELGRFDLTTQQLSVPLDSNNVAVHADWFYNTAAAPLATATPTPTPTPIPTRTPTPGPTVTPRPTSTPLPPCDRSNQNPNNHHDVDGNGGVTSSDALTIINAINAGGSRWLASKTTMGPPYLDPDGDCFVSGSDSLAVINYINAHP